MKDDNFANGCDDDRKRVLVWPPIARPVSRSGASAVASVPAGSKRKYSGLEGSAPIKGGPDGGCDGRWSLGRLEAATVAAVVLAAAVFIGGEIGRRLVLGVDGKDWTVLKLEGAKSAGGEPESSGGGSSGGIIDWPGSAPPDPQRHNWDDL